MTARVPHQLSIHIDHAPAEDGSAQLSVVWSYPHAGEFSISERRVNVPVTDLPPDVNVALEELLAQLRERILTRSVRLPHRSVQTTARDAITTVVLQDQRRTDLPRARMCYLEELPATATRTEREVHLRKEDHTASRDKSWETLRQWAKKVAWDDYCSLFEP
jgi:hypothetical protein